MPYRTFIIPLAHLSPLKHSHLPVMSCSQVAHRSPFLPDIEPTSVIVHNRPPPLHPDNALGSYPASLLALKLDYPNFLKIVPDIVDTNPSIVKLARR